MCVCVCLRVWLHVCTDVRNSTDSLTVIKRYGSPATGAAYGRSGGRRWCSCIGWSQGSITDI